MKKKSFQIALAAMSCALAAIFMNLGINVSFLIITGYVFGAVSLMLPLAKNFYAGGFLAYLATCLLCLPFGGIGFFYKLFPFIVFFGLHPLVNHLQVRFHWNKVVLLIVKIVWFDVAAYLAWRFVFGMTTTFDWIDQYILPVIAVGGSLFFGVYDMLIFRCQRAVDRIVARISKK